MENNTLNMKPKFKITNNMLSDLTSIHASREIILSAHILPKFKRRLKIQI